MFSIFSQILRRRQIFGNQHDRGLKIAVLGGMNRIGSTLCLLLKQSPWFDEIAIHDDENPKGLALELNHIDTLNIATPHYGNLGVRTALEGADIVMLVGNLWPEKQNIQMRENVFTSNCKYVYDLSKQSAAFCPKAFLAICAEPVNSTLPIACEVYKRINRYVDPNKMFGVTTVNVIRANALLAEVTQTKPESIEVPVIGGQSPSTMVPVLSKSKPTFRLSTEEVVRITRSLQTANDDVEKAKEYGGVACLSMGFAAARFAISLAKALNGEGNVIECTYLMSNIVPELNYFSTPVQLGSCGVQKNFGIPDLSSYEYCLLETAISYLKKDIEKGENFFRDMARNLACSQ